MTSITLSNSGGNHPFSGIYRWSLRRHMGISILYALLLFLVMPGALLIGLSQNYNYVNVVNGLFPALVFPITMLFTLIFSLLHFNYLHKKRRVDLYCALPVKRNTMLLAKLCAAATHILVPLLVNCLIAGMIISCNYNIFEMNNKPGCNLPMVTGLLCLAVLCSLAFSALIAVCCGTSMDTVVSILVINGIFPVLVAVVGVVSACLLPGVLVNSSILPMVYTLLCPYGSLASFYVDLNMAYRMSSVQPVHTGLYALWWMFFLIAALAAALLLNRRRKSESAENAFAFAIPNIAIRIAASVTAGLAGGYLMAQIMEGTNGQFLLGMALGSLLAHLILEAIYSRGLRKLLRSLPCYGGALAVLVCFMLVLLYGMTGVVNRVPTADEVQQVTVTKDWNSYTSNALNHMGYYDERDSENTFREPALTDPHLIAKVIQLQQEVINETRSVRYNSFRQLNDGLLRISYQLKDGTSLTREYNINNHAYNSISAFPQGSKGEELLDEILDSREFKESANSIFHIDASMIDRFSVEDYSKPDSSRQTLMTTAQEKQELLEALRQDVLNSTMAMHRELFESFNYYDKMMLNIAIVLTPPGKESANIWEDPYFIPEYYTNTRKVLEKLEEKSE